MPAKPVVAVVILNWNGRKFLESFLPGVIEFSSSEAKIVVADNASTDDSVEYLTSHFPQVEIIRNNQNYGFTTGYNKALAQVDADYYLLLNSDIEVTAGWLTPLIALMESDQKIAACQPVIRAYNQKEYFEYAGAAGGYIDRYGYPFCRGRIFSSLEKDNGQYQTTTEVFWATGACMMVRASLYRSMGGLDDDFFAHMEEIDFCWRLKNAGYKIFVCHESVVFHVGGGTLPKNNPRKTFLNFRNNLYLLVKNSPDSRLAGILMMRRVFDLIAMLKFALEGHFADARTIPAAYREFRKNKDRMRLKRGVIPDTPPGQIYWGKIVLRHYILRAKKFSKLNPERFTRSSVK
ncbi:MAG: glycosyltransferase family 2 protein [Bacteroidetes bacterium]|nr:glycosyltransferase family 2 protein [Bacteroidota bacterium]MBU1720657.1 glycosyltransferase family 2 protein [Bacteroidota bacterium]